MNKSARELCAVCGQAFTATQLRAAATIRPTISKIIVEDGIAWDDSQKICLKDLAGYRRRYVESLLEEERGELSKLDREVVESLLSGTPIALSTVEPGTEELSFAERAADRVASFGGSWTFILLFCAFIFLWVALNVTHLLFLSFDPYPFILLNLLLSCVAALQAPIIMMSQRRVEQKDRARAENDYKVNLKAELEIRQLHEKLDHQIANQWQRLVEIQQVQIDMLEDARR